MAMNNPYAVYKNNSVNHASKEQLLLMILDGAVKFAKISRQAMIDKDIQKAHDNVIKTQNVYYELINSLDNNSGAEWTTVMLNIYDFVIRRLSDANIKKDVKIMDEIIPLIEDVRDTWEEAYKISKMK